MATSVAGSNAKGVANSTLAFVTAPVTVVQGVTVQIYPTEPTMAVDETLQFTATVGGTSNTAVSWTVKTNVTGADGGTISPSGLYQAPEQVPSGSVTVVATSADDPAVTASTVVTIEATPDMTITSIHPATATEYSVQQDVYVLGTNFLQTGTVVVGQPPATVAVPTTFISATLLRATIPASQLAQAGNLAINVSTQLGDLSTNGPANLAIAPSRPAVVASTPRSALSGGSTIDVNLTGGHFGTSTGVQFNGQAAALDSSANNDSRHLSVVIPLGSLSIPGLYPLVVQNGDAASAGVPSMTAVNLAVQPAPANIPTSSPFGPISVGSNPSAVDVDKADGIAVVVNSGDDSVSLIDLNPYPAGSPSLITTITGVGNSGDQLTSVAVDDLLLPHPLALVVDSTNQTVVAIDLTTQQIAAVSVSIGPTASSPVPYSIGVNPLTHRAIVAYQSTDQATILDVSTGTPVVVQQVGGVLTHYSTGVLPAVAIDPQLNWAVVTPGGSVQSTNLVDLGTNDGRSPQVIGSLTASATVQGVGINAETHQALLTDPSAGSFTSYSLLDNAVNSITFRNPDGSLFNELHFVAAAANQLANIGVAVDEDTDTAAVVDLERGTVLQTGIQVGSSPEAVAVDPGKNLAVVTNQGSNTVTILSLGSIRSTGASPSPQIVESSPSFAYTPATAGTTVTLTIIGAGFVSASQVLLDGTSIQVVSVSANGREIVATVPANMLAAARRYAITVQNPANGGVSNASALSVVQAVGVGSSPVGVAVDRERDLAVVSNSVDDTVSLVALSPTTPTGPNGVQAGKVGTIGQPVVVGITPYGVAVLPRLGWAVVANYGSSNISWLDVTETNGAISTPVALCSACTGATGVAIDEDAALAVVTNSTNPNGSTNYYASIVSLPQTLSGTATDASNPSVGDIPTGVAVDPNLEVASISASEDNSVNYLPFGASVLSYSSTAGLSLPAGVAFDSLNQVFLVANSLANSVVIVDPLTRIPTSARTGINPTSVDYDFQTSTLVTFNSESGTVSALDYVCPPIQGTACPTPQVRTVIGLGESLPASATPIGANAISIDMNLDIAVVVDQGNNRVLLVPLPY
jgi:DNA-binding beta-propeller fold protein YncE